METSIPTLDLSSNSSFELVIEILQDDDLLLLPDTGSQIPTTAYECASSQPSSSITRYPDFVDEFLKNSLIRKLIYKAGITNHSKDIYPRIKQYIYQLVSDLVIKANALTEYNDCKVMKESHIKSILDLQGHYIYEN